MRVCVRACVLANDSLLVETQLRVDADGDVGDVCGGGDEDDDDAGEDDVGGGGGGCGAADGVFLPSKAFCSRTWAGPGCSKSGKFILREANV